MTAHSPLPSPPRFGGRLHPAAVALEPLRRAGPLLLLAVTGSAFGMGGAGVVVLLGVSAAVAAAGWWCRRWELGPDALVVEEGLLGRRRRVVPVAQVQAVDLGRTVWHRLLGVVEVRVETASGGTEATLDALHPATAARLREALLHLAGRVPSPGATATPPLVALRPRAVLQAGLTGGRVGVAAALAGVAWQLGGERFSGLADVLPGLGAGRAALVAGAGVIVIFVVSVLATAAVFWGFTLRRDGDVLTVSRGLLEQRFDTVPLARVQAVEIAANPLRRVLGTATVRVVVAGRAGGEEAAQQAVLLPYGSMKDALRLAGAVLGGTVGSGLAAMPEAARRRRVVRGVLAGLVATAVAAGWAWPSGLAVGVVAVPGGVGAGLASYRALGWRVDQRWVQARSGALVRRLVVAPRGKVQAVEVTASPMQRAAGVATVQVHVAGREDAGPRLRDLSADDVAVLLDVLPGAVHAGTTVAAGYGSR